MNWLDILDESSSNNFQVIVQTQRGFNSVKELLLLKHIDRDRAFWDRIPLKLWTLSSQESFISFANSFLIISENFYFGLSRFIPSFQLSKESPNLKQNLLSIKTKID